MEFATENKTVNNLKKANQLFPGKEPFFSHVMVQPKLTVGSPDDPMEREADAMADSVMRMSAALPNEHTFFKPATAIQRKCAHCEEDEKKAQRKENSDKNAEASLETENYIRKLSGGKSLNKDERNFFEPRIGYDFSNVQLHTDTEADQSAKNLNAYAYTHGNHIVFGAGQYQPGTGSGKKLLAHELTHVVQQNSQNTARRVAGGESISEEEDLSAMAGEIIQRDYAVELPVPDAVSALTPDQVAEAVAFDIRVLRDINEMRMIRDVLGISPEPAEINDDFVVALADFQAQSNITIDGKLGSITASRLSRELHAESRYLRRHGGGGQDERRFARRMDRRSLNITVTQAAAERTNTGSAEYKVQWSVPDRQANGWVIQHVTFSGSKTDCAGNAVATNTRGSEYWEGWQVRNGQVFVGSSATAHVADTFATADEGAGTRGSLTISGHVTFMPGFNLQEPPWGHTFPQARALPTLGVAPPGWSDSLARTHRMNVIWDDCVAPATHSVTTRP